MHKFLAFVLDHINEFPFEHRLESIPCVHNQEVIDDPGRSECRIRAEIEATED
jgi:hypothetical protein